MVKTPLSEAEFEVKLDETSSPGPLLSAAELDESLTSAMRVLLTLLWPRKASDAPEIQLLLAPVTYQCKWKRVAQGVQPMERRVKHEAKAAKA